MHVQEPPGVWVEFLDPSLRDRVTVGTREQALPIADGRPLIDLPTPPEGRREMRPTMMVDRYGDLARRGFDAPALLEGMDVEGVDVAALFPSYGLYVPWADHLAPELAVGLAQSYNRWIVSLCADGDRRLVPVALGTPARPGGNGRRDPPRGHRRRREGDHAASEPGAGAAGVAPGTRSLLRRDGRPRHPGDPPRGHGCGRRGCRVGPVRHLVRPPRRVAPDGADARPRRVDLRRCVRAPPASPRRHVRVGHRLAAAGGCTVSTSTGSSSGRKCPRRSSGRASTWRASA